MRIDCAHFAHQLKAILWKNWLLKRARLVSTLAELFLPVIFMSLLVLIKKRTNVYISPNVAFHCGNTYPWYYVGSLGLGPAYSLSSEIPFVCTQKPVTCEQNNYYQFQSKFSSPGTPPSGPNASFVNAFAQYGFLKSSASALTSGNPFYSFTIADTSRIYDQMSMTSPSLPMTYIMKRLAKAKSILAIAPADSSSSPLLQVSAQNLTAYFKGLQRSYSSTIQYFSSSAAIDAYIANKDYDSVTYGTGKVAFAIILHVTDVTAAQWEYSIRANYTRKRDMGQRSVACLRGSTYSLTNRTTLTNPCHVVYSIPSTKSTTDDLTKPQISDHIFGYTYSGFATIQQAVDQYIFKQYTYRAVKIRASVSPMPSAAYEVNTFQQVVASTLGIFYMLSFLFPVSRLVRALVLEKETRIKEGMKMMGLTDTIYILSWFITTLIQMTIVAVFITIATSHSVFEYSHKIYVFVYFETFGIAIMSFCYLLATFFARSKTAAFLGPLIFFATFFPYYAVNDPAFAPPVKTAASLLAPTAFALGADVFAALEGGMVGLRRGNLTSSIYNYSYRTCILMLLLDSVLYGVLAWYLDKVLPTEHGAPLAPHFFLLPSYWQRARPTPPTAVGTATADTGTAIATGTGTAAAVRVTPVVRGLQRVGQQYTLGASSDSDSHTDSHTDTSYSHSQSPHTSPSLPHQHLEQAPAALRTQLADERRGVCIRGLRKTFKTIGAEQRVAVEGLDMDLHEGEVTVLLGHNGAGKSTTISMLVGLLSPSGGTATINGLDIASDMQKIRRQLGVCPQHDILFPELTVMQHLQIFASFKGVEPTGVDEAAQNMIAEVGLLEKTHARSETLSGGQKRKLSLGIALIGDSSVIILDEPTSAMDPYSRRSTWNIIQRNKKGRVILLTTHYMDEADLLGDRIAIMADGKLQCMGSPLFLKRRYGVGYTLTLVKQSQMHHSEPISTLVKGHVSSAMPLSDVGSEQSFRIPFEAAAQFPALFRDLDDSKEGLGITQYGISVTTLEEVFLQVCGGAGPEDISAAEPPLAVASATGPTVEGCHARNSVTASPSASSLARAVAVGGEPTVVMAGQWGAIEPTKVSPVFTSSIETVTGGNALPAVVPAHASLTIQPITPVVEPIEYQSIGDMSPMKLFHIHFFALLKKRLLYGMRDRRMCICQLLLPVVLILLGLSLLLILPSRVQPDLILSPAMFNDQLPLQRRNPVPLQVIRDVVTASPTLAPFVTTSAPSRIPTVAPSGPSYAPTVAPSDPTFSPTPVPTKPTGMPTPNPTIPTVVPTATPTISTVVPTATPTSLPAPPTAVPIPFTLSYTAPPLVNPTFTPAPPNPTAVPSPAPSITPLVVSSVAVPARLSPYTVTAPAQTQFIFSSLFSSNGLLQHQQQEQHELLIESSNFHTEEPVAESSQQQALHILALAQDEQVDIVSEDQSLSSTTRKDLNPDGSVSPENLAPSNVAWLMAQRFTGDPGHGVLGVAVASTSYTNDSFSGCSQGAVPLLAMSNSLLGRHVPTSELGASRYGAVSISDLTDRKNLVYNIMVNTSAVHGVGIFANLVHQAYLQAITGISDARITVHNHPLPITLNQKKDSSTTNAFVLSLFVMIAFSFIPASFATFIVKEREVKAKHQQVISGVSIYAYWCSSWVWDVLSYLPTAAAVIGLIFAFNVSAYTKGSSASAMVFLLLMFGPSIASATYLASFLFQSHSTAQVVVMFFNFITGLCCMVLLYVLTLIQSTVKMSLRLRYLFRLFPSFCLGDGLLRIALCASSDRCPTVDAVNGGFGEPLVSPLSWEVAGGNLVFMLCETVVYFLLTVAIEYALTFPHLVSWVFGVHDPGISVDELLVEDEDVRAERERVMSGRAGHDLVNLQELRKVYSTTASSPIQIVLNNCRKAVAAAVSRGRGYQRGYTDVDAAAAAELKVAVQSLCFGIPRGECFGFLGINGAGKSSTLSMLSGEFPPTSGAAYIDGHSISNDQSKIRQKMGYCPQGDALFELLSVREHLELYGRIKGLQGQRLVDTVEAKLLQLDLTDFHDKAAGSLSGGNKRKLSVAVALMGDPSPSVVFLDEPSTGMDPVARRFMWHVISKITTQDSLCSVILTTHSMEEAEALCSRIGVMVNGRLQCLGSSQHLKARFGGGYEAHFKTREPTEDEIVGLAGRLFGSTASSLVSSVGSTETLRAAPAHAAVAVAVTALGEDTTAVCMGESQRPVQSEATETKNSSQTLAIDVSVSVPDVVAPAAVQGSPFERHPTTSYSSPQPVSSILQLPHCISNGRESALSLVDLSQVTVGPDDLPLLCLTLGQPHWADRISELGSGSSLNAAVQVHGKVSLEAFARWWVVEEQAARLGSFLEMEFGGGVELLERSSPHTYRYKLPHATAASGEPALPNSVPSNGMRRCSQPLLAGAEGSTGIVTAGGGGRGTGGEADFDPASPSSVKAISTSRSSSLACIFERLEATKAELRVQEYSVGQTTLEQIFNRFAASQENPEVARAGPGSV